MIHNPKCQPKALLTFNVFFREDTSTRLFLKSVISKTPEHWAFFRNIFKGQDKCTLTLVDRSIETPFQCLFAAIFLNQLSSELNLCFKTMKLILTPIGRCKAHGTTTVNSAFETTKERDIFMETCLSTVMAQKISVTTKRNPIYCRDLKIESTNHALFIRCEGGIAYGWQLVDSYACKLTKAELLKLHSQDLPCSNIFSHAFSRNGIFINVDLQALSRT